MSTFKVDNEQVNNSVETLRTLLDECKEAYEKKIPESTVDKGQTHNELQDLCTNLKSTCYCLGELINNSILFLGQSSEMFEVSDKDSAAAITGAVATTGSVVTASHQSTSSSSASSNSSKINHSDVGKVVAGVTDENGNLRYPYSQYTPDPSWTQTDKLQCVGYVKGRFEELTGVNPNISCSLTGYAVDYKTTYTNDSRLEWVTDVKSIRVPAIAVTKGVNDSWGHVLIVEDVSVDASGNVAVYYTEGNAGVDGQLKMKSYSDFCGGYTNPYGFIQLKA